MRKIFFVLLSIFLILPFNHASAVALYTDVQDSYEAKAELDFLAAQGIIKANHQEAFGINEALTRIQAVQLLANALKLDYENAPVASFKDIAEDDENLPLILAISHAKIMNGNEKGEFRPHDALTRAQMATILVKTFGLSGTSDHSFIDVSKTSSASLAVQILVANKITAGYSDNTFRPSIAVTKGDFAIHLARILNSDFRESVALPETTPSIVTPVQPTQPTKTNPSCAKPAKRDLYKINVAVTNIWDSPTISRKMDQPSLLHPVNLTSWVSSMNIPQKRWLVDRVHTQSIFGDEVTVLKSSGSWYRIALHDQYVPYQKEGYPGWVPKSHVAKVTSDYSDCSIAIVTSKLATLYNEVNKKKFIDISYSTILPVMEEDENNYHVQTPTNGIKLLKKSDAKVYANYKDVPKPTAQTIVDEAMRYVGLPYLWGGTSAYGFDCSGITYAVYRNHGIMIPRDSFYQAIGGKAVTKKELKAGDLVFFAYNNGNGKVYHVGLYIGGGKMLHAPNPSSKIRIEKLDSGVYKKNYSGARRYLD